MTLAITNPGRAPVCARALQRLVLLIIFFSAVGFAAPASASVSCPGLFPVEIVLGSGAYSAQITADARTKGCSAIVPIPADGVAVVLSYSTNGNPFAGLSFTSHTNGALNSGSLSCQGPGCYSQTGEIAVFLPSAGAAAFTYSYLDGAGAAITMTVQWPGGGNSPYIQNFALSGGLWDSFSPAVTRILPNTGVTTGGTPVTITGTDFTGVTNVAIGGASVTSFTVVSPTQITATTAPNSAGSANVLVTTPGGTGIQYGAFTYQLPDQAALNVSAAPPPVVGATSTLTTTGGSGIGAVTYAVIPSGVLPDNCAITGTTVTGVHGGICPVKVTKSGDLIYNDAVVTVSVNIGPGTQAPLTAFVFPATLTAGGTASLATSGGSGTGTITYSVTSGGASCGVVGNQLTATAAGSCTITATKASSADYSATTSQVNIAVTAGTTPQAALSVTASPPTMAAGGSANLVTTGGSGSGAVTYGVTTGASVCSISGNVVTGLTGGSCTITAAKAGDSTFASATATTTINVGQTQAPLAVSAALPLAYQGFAALTTTGGSGTGAISYAVTSGGSTCSIAFQPGPPAATGISASGVGPCTITATKAADGTYGAATATLNVTVSPAVQGAFSVNAFAPSIAVAASTTVTGAGGSGAGTVSYAITSGAASCSISGKVVTGTSPGVCTVTATKDGLGLYAPVTGSAVINVGAGATAQAALTGAASPSILPGTSTNIIATGGSGTGALFYALTSGGQYCSLSGNTLLGTALGTCTVTVTKSGDATFASSKSVVSVVVALGNQAVLSVAMTPTPLPVFGTTALSATGGSGTGAVAYSVSFGAAACSVSGATLTATAIGTCSITATKAGDTQYYSQTGILTVTTVKAVQAPLTVTSAATTILSGQTTLINASGGSGTGALSYFASPIPNCGIAGTTLTGRAAGTCGVTVTRSGDTNYNATSTNITISVAAAVQPPLSVTVSAMPTVGGTATLGTTGGAGTGAVSYAVTAGAGFCSLAGNVVTGLSVGSCTITATKAGDAGFVSYLPSSALATVTVGPGAQATLSVIASPASIGFGTTSTLSSSGGSGTGAVSYAVTSGAGFCSIVGSTLTGTGVGTCTITATKAADANHIQATSAASPIIVNLGNQTALTASASPAGIPANGTSALGSTGGSGTGAVTYAVTAGGTFCSIAGSTLTGLAVGTCTVTATKAADASYNAASSTVSVSVGKAPQAALTAIASPATILFNGTSTLSASGGSGTGAVTYAVTAGGSFCSIAGWTLTGAGVGTCTVTATKASDINFAAATATAIVTVNQAAQAVLAATATPSAIAFNGTSTLGSTGGSGTGAVTYAVATGGAFCSIAGTTLTGTGVGSCTITATKTADANYTATTSAAKTVTVGLATQAVISATASPAATLANGTSALSTTGGSGTGAVSYAVSAGGGFCSISGATLTGTAAGTCTVTATKASDANFAAATATVNVTVGKAAQAALTVSGTPPAIVVNGASTLSTAGGSGAGAVTYAVTAGGTFCSLAGTTLTGIAAGTCTVTATKAADATYSAATATLNVTVGQSAQAIFSSTAAPATIFFNANSLLSATGGSGTGAVSYAVSAGGTFCSITGSTLKGIGVGACTVTATKAADANYTAATAVVAVTVVPAAQAVMTATASPMTIAANGTSTLSAVGGSGIGAVTYAVTSGGGFCSVAGAALTGLATGSCIVTATKAADANFSASSAAVNVTVVAAAQAALNATASPAAFLIGGSATLATTGGSGTGAVTYAVTAGGGFCSILGTTMTGTAAGNCIVTASKAGDAVYNAATATVSVTIGKIAQTALNVSASPGAMTVGSTSALSTSGGSGTGAVIYAVTSGGSLCAVTGTTLSATDTGICQVTATKAADTNFAATTGFVDIAVGPGAQAALTVVPSPAIIAIGTISNLSTKGGAGTGAVSYTLTAGNSFCTLTGTALTGTGVGLCTVSATKAADAKYTAVTATVDVTVRAQAQIITFAKPANQPFTPGKSIALSATSSSALAVTLTSATVSVCTVSGASAAAVTPGKCSIVANQTGDPNFAPAAPVTQTFVIAGATTTVSLKSSAATLQPGQMVTLTATVSPATATGTLSFKDGARVLCGNVSLSNGHASCRFAATGNLAVTATLNGSGTFASASSGVMKLVISHSVAKTVAAAARFLKQRASLIVSGLFDGDRQIDRLADAGAAADGKSNEDFMTGNRDTTPRLGSGSGTAEFARMNLGSRINEMMSDRAGLRQSSFDDSEQSAPGRRLPFDVDGSTEGASHFGFSTSLSKITRLNEEADAAKVQAGVAESAAGLTLGAGRSTFNPFDMWVEGKYSSFRNNDSDADVDGHFANLSTGADYVVNPSFLIGAFVEFDDMRQSSHSQHANLSGKGWLAGPYATVKVTQNIFWQARAGWGQATNEAALTAAITDEFDSERHLISTTLAGSWTSGAWQLHPTLSLSYLEETAESYTDSSGAVIPEIATHLGQIKTGPTISYRYQPYASLSIEPRIGMEVIWDFAADTQAIGFDHIGNEPVGGGVHGRSEIGVRAATRGGINLDLSASYDGIGSSSYRAVAGRTSVQVPLN